MFPYLIHPLAVYVEAEEASCCNDLVFQLGNDGFSGQTVAGRQWSIKVATCKKNMFPKLYPKCQCAGYPIFLLLFQFGTYRM